MRYEIKAAPEFLPWYPLYVSADSPEEALRIAAARMLVAVPRPDLAARYDGAEKGARTTRRG